MQITALSQVNLGSLSIPVPSYDRSRLKAGIVHVGVGGFHRARQAMYTDRLMEQGEALDWAICGVGVMPFDLQMKQAMEAQDCLYTLVSKREAGSRGSSDRSCSFSTRQTIRRPFSRRWPTRGPESSHSPSLIGDTTFIR